MMTDEQKLVTLFHDFGIEPEVVHSLTPKEETDKIHVTIEQGIGYAGFCCTFVFDSNGKFESYGVYE